MKIDVEEIKAKYLPYIFKIIYVRLQENPHLDDTQAQIGILEAVLEDLAKVGESTGQYGEGSLLALIKKITNARCFDAIRHAQVERKRHIKIRWCGYNDNWRMQGPLPKLSHKIDYRAIVKRSRHAALLMDVGNGLSRRQIARKHGLGEQQVKGRIAYARKKIRAEIRRQYNLLQIKDSKRDR